MAMLHFVMQGKGGVGKTFIASLLLQYLKSVDVPIKAVDTDPVNNTLAGYKEFEVQVLDITEGTDINIRAFDILADICVDLPENGHLVVDNGAGSFMPICTYIEETHLFDILKGSGHTIMVHTIITGGQGMQDTINGLKTLLLHFEGINFVVWMNPKDGPIKFDDGRSVYEEDVFKNNEDKLLIIELPIRNHATYGKDLSEHLRRRQTFESAIKNGSLPIMVRHRLKNYWNDVRDLISRVIPL
jgi:hypothetical protein